MRTFLDRAHLGVPITISCVFFLSSVAALAAEDAEDTKTEHAHEHEHAEHDDVETIVVTGSPLQHDRDELALPVYRVDQEELIRNLGSTLGESLDQLPGIATTGYAAGASRPVIRGQDAFRTEILEDGLGMHDVSRESPDHAVPINPLSARRVEIVRGPATLRYGGGASAGVVNTITNRVPDRLPDDAIQGEVFGGIGLVSDERDLAARLDGHHGDLAWHADGVLRQANNYSVPNDGNPHTQTGSQFDNYAGSLGSAYFLDKGRVGFSYTRVESDYGIPEVDELARIDMHTDRYRFEGDWLEPAAWIREVRLRGVYSNYEHKEIAEGVVGQTFRNEEFEARVEMLHEPIWGFLGAVGLHARDRDLRTEGEAASFLAPTDTHSVAIYTFEEHELPGDLSAELGFRAEYVRVQGEDIADLHRDREFAPVSGAIGLVSTPIDWLTLGARASISQRAPSESELFASGPHEATETFEIGDPDLDPETSYSFDLRAKAESERGHLEVAGFVTQYDDYIFGAQTGNEVDEDGVVVAPGTPGSLQQIVYQHRDAIFYGAEVSGDIVVYERQWGNFGLDGQFDFVRARFLRGAYRNLPRIVPIRFGAGVYFKNERFDARIGFLRTESQEDVAQFETSTASFTYLNASLAYRLSLLEDRVPVEFTIVAKNLNDVRGRNHLAFNKDDVQLPGRSIRFGLRARF